MKQNRESPEFAEIAALPLPWEQLREKRIVITGATGLLGRYLTAFLCWLNAREALGMELWLFRRPGAAAWVSAPWVHWMEGRITEDFLPGGCAPQIIFHIASPARKAAIAADPAGLPEANILATRYLLEKAAQCGAAVVFFSSVEVYPEQDTAIVEKAPSELARTGARLSLYGAAKLSGELLCEKYHRTSGVDYRIVRPFHICGPGEPPEHGRFFANFLKQIRDTGEITVTGTGTPVREFCYLSDFVSGVLYVLLKGENTVYNLGNADNRCTIWEAARRIADVCGGTVNGPLGTGAPAPRPYLVSDTTKLRRLGWRPKIDFTTCIKRCLDGCRTAPEKGEELCRINRTSGSIR